MYSKTNSPSSTQKNTSGWVLGLMHTLTTLVERASRKIFEPLWSPHLKGWVSSHPQLSYWIGFHSSSLHLTPTMSVQNRHTLHLHNGVRDMSSSSSKHEAWQWLVFTSAEMTSTMRDTIGNWMWGMIQVAMEDDLPETYTIFHDESGFKVEEHLKPKSMKVNVISFQNGRVDLHTLINNTWHVYEMTAGNEFERWYARLNLMTGMYQRWMVGVWHNVTYGCHLK